MNPYSSRASQQGLGLVELMIAMLLGLLVAGSAVAIFSTNRQAYAATESLGRIQENSRMAYEMMARDLREAGGTPCAKGLPMANVTSGSSWWQTWGNGSIVGYNKGATGLPTGAPTGLVTQGDAIIALMSDDAPLSVVSHDNVNGKFTVNMTPTGYNPLDVVVVCDYRQASMFQVMASGIDTSNKTISYSKSGINCTKDLSMPANCASVKNGIQYGNNAMIGRLRAVAWYIKNNQHNVPSLFQSQLGSDGTTSQVTDQEIVEGVSGMTVTYLVSGATGYVDAGSVGASNWANVVAARISLTLQGGQGQEHVSTTGYGALTRTLVQTVSLRNHKS